MPEKKSANFVENEDDSISIEEVDDVIEVTFTDEKPNKKAEDKPKMGTVYGQGDRGKLVIVEESDEN